MTDDRSPAPVTVKSFSREAIVMFSRGLSAAPVSHHAMGTGVDTERAVGGAAGP